MNSDHLINLPWVHVRFHQKIGSDPFSRFAVYWIQTTQKTPRQAMYIYIIKYVLCILCVYIFLFILFLAFSKVIRQGKLIAVALSLLCL